MMDYVWLAIGVAIVGLYGANKLSRAELATAKAETASVRQQLDDLSETADRNEDARKRRIAELTAAQAQAAAAQRAQHTATVASMRAKAKAELEHLKETLYAYVTPAADAHCTVPRGFLMWHDAAARGDDPDQVGAGLPPAAGGSVDADSGVRLSLVAGAVGTNYRLDDLAIAECQAEVKAWRGWYTTESARFNAP